MKKLFYFLAILLLSQCNNSKSGAGDLIEIDISKGYHERELYIQDIAKIEYIPLETNKNALMRGTNAIIFHVSDNYIVAADRRDGYVFVFDGKGNFKYSFNHTGNGPAEYRVVATSAFDEQAKEIYVFHEYSPVPKFLVYSESGEFKRQLECPPNLKTVWEIYNFDDSSLLIYDECDPKNNTHSNNPYMFISKNDGRIDTLDLFFSNRISNRIITEMEFGGQKRNMTLGLSDINNRSYGKNFLIADRSSDTIYRLTTQKKLQPLIVRKPSVYDSYPHTIITNHLITDRFIFLGKRTLDFEAAKNGNVPETIELIYDFRTGELNRRRLANKDCEDLRVTFYQTITSENTGVCLIDVARLFELNEEGKVKGELKELLKTLDEEDNPILMKMSFF